MTKNIKAYIVLGGFLLLTIVSLITLYYSNNSIPSYIDKQLNKVEKEKIIQNNSELTDYVYLSPNATFPRTKKIKKITIHHMADNLSLEEVGDLFPRRDRKASSNYAIDIYGNVGLYVEETNQAWTSSSENNDSQAITIEIANDKIGGDWHISDDSYETLINLCVDICKRNKIKSLNFTGDETGNLTLHKMFNSTTQCPGPYLESKIEELVTEINFRLSNY